MRYIMLPQLPKRAIVESDHSGQKTANNEVEMGPKEFHIIPCEKLLIH